MPKDPEQIKNSLRVLHGKVQLYPNDITVIRQALVDLSYVLTELTAKLRELESELAAKLEVLEPDQIPEPSDP